MSDIEEMVRESLRTAPAVLPSVSDPVAAVTARVRRARVAWGGGLAVGVAVAAAVVVPLVFVGSGASDRGGIGPASTPPSTALTPDAQGVTVWQPQGAVAVTAGGGWLWELERNPQSPDGGGYVVKVDPQSHAQVQKWAVGAPYDELAYGDGMVWVWSTSTHADVVVMQGLIQAVDIASSGAAARYPVTNEAIDYLSVLDDPRGAANALAVVGNTVRQLHAGAGSISVVGTMTLPSSNIGGLAATGAGDYWVCSGGRLLELDLAPAPDGSRPLGAAPRDTVQFAGRLLGPAGAEAIWVQADRLIALSPTLLHTGDSVAQGDRIAMPGIVTAVAPDGSGGLFVSVEPSQIVLQGGEQRPGLYHLSRAMIDGNESVTPATPFLAGVSPTELAPDGHGGVDFVTASGAAEHWQP